MKKYLLSLALVVLLGTTASMAFAGPFVALEYNTPVSITSVPVATGDSLEAFSDIPTDFWAWAEILECSVTPTAATDAIVHGYGDGSYQDTFEVTRGMMAVFVANGAGYTDDAPATPTFPDVPDSYWAFSQIEQCVLNSVVSGYEDGLFRPAVTVTRDQMAVFLANATGLATGANDGRFADVEDGFWAEDEIFACVENNIALGFADNTYRPARVVTRDAMAVFVWRALVRLDGNSVVLGSGGTTDFVPAGGEGTADLFLPDDMAGATGAADEDLAEGVVAYIVLDAVQAADGDIVFDVLDSDGASVATDFVTVDKSADWTAVDTSGGIPWLVAVYQIESGVLAAGDYTVTATLQNGAVVEIGAFTI